MQRKIVCLLIFIGVHFSTLRSELIYVAIDGDDIGSQVEIAALTNDPQRTYMISKQIRDSFAAVQKYVKKMSNRKATIILFGGDSLAFALDKKLLKKVDSIRDYYTKVSGFTITIGVGETISKASQALLYGKHTGKNKTVEWSSDIFTVLNNIQRKTEEEKIGWILNQVELV